MDMPEDGAEFELYLLRHAHAGDSSKWTGPDSERPLSQKGKRQAERLGSFLAERGFAPDSIITSPKLRARQTADLFADAIGIAVAVDDRLGGPLDVDDVNDIVERAGGTSVVLVGHDPSFSDLAAQLTGTEYLPMKKGALVRIDVSLPLAANGGVLRWLLPPELVSDHS
ncbi:MAG TPA: phosphohistidine phosphatase SixA [Candidatus Limnocylindrales bacterium]|jgi:phosphohistidine phosphatase